MCSPTFTVLPQARDVAIEPADTPIAVVVARKRRESFSPTLRERPKFVSCLRIGATSLVLTLLWVQQPHAQVASRQAPANGPKTLLEALNGTDAGQGNESGNDDDRLDPDRPHFPEATTAVGKDRVMLESGYTFATKDSSFLSHSYPEAVLRVGMFADWFEFRIGQSFVHEEEKMGGMTNVLNGAQDLYLGMKLALTKQRDLFPAIAVIPQMMVPTGSNDFTANRVLPGLNVDMSWEIVKNFFSVEMLIANNQVVGTYASEIGTSHFETATGITAAFQVTKKLEAFAEWDAIYQIDGSERGPRHYAVGGLVYFISNNLEVDARAGVGLNDRSNSLIAGVGFAVRF